MIKGNAIEVSLKVAKEEGRKFDFLLSEEGEYRLRLSAIKLRITNDSEKIEVKEIIFEEMRGE